MCLVSDMQAIGMDSWGRVSICGKGSLPNPPHQGQVLQAASDVAAFGDGEPEFADDQGFSKRGSAGLDVGFQVLYGPAVLSGWVIL